MTDNCFNYKLGDIVKVKGDIYYGNLKFNSSENEIYGIIIGHEILPPDNIERFQIECFIIFNDHLKKGIATIYPENISELVYRDYEYYYNSVCKFCTIPKNINNFEICNDCYLKKNIITYKNNINIFDKINLININLTSIVIGVYLSILLPYLSIGDIKNKKITISNILLLKKRTILEIIEDNKNYCNSIISSSLKYLYLIKDPKINYNNIKYDNHYYTNFYSTSSETENIQKIESSKELIKFEKNKLLPIICKQCIFENSKECKKCKEED